MSWKAWLFLSVGFNLYVPLECEHLNISLAISVFIEGNFLVHESFSLHITFRSYPQKETWLGKIENQN